MRFTGVIDTLASHNSDVVLSTSCQCSPRVDSRSANSGAEVVCHSLSKLEHTSSTIGSRHTCAQRRCQEASGNEEMRLKWLQQERVTGAELKTSTHHLDLSERGCWPACLQDAHIAFVRWLTIVVLRKLGRYLLRICTSGSRFCRRNPCARGQSPAM